MKAVILAAGEGKRLQPLTNFKPKHLLPIAGKPILNHILDSISKTKIKQVIIVVKYMKEKIIENYQKTYKNMFIDFVEQNEFLGTADAIKQTREIIGREDFLVVNGDVLTSFLELKGIIENYEHSSPLCVLGLKKVDAPCSYGVVEVKKDRIVKIEEKPKSASKKSTLINAGIMCFNNKIFDYIKKTPLSERGEYEITKSIEIAISENEWVLPYIIKSWWVDVGKPWDMLESNKLLLSEIKEKHDGVIEEGAYIKGQVIIHKNAIIRSGAYIQGPVIIDEGSEIGPNCYIRPSTYIGKNCHIGNACEIKNSIIMEKTSIGHLSYVGDSIIGSNVNFGAGTIIANLRFDDKTVKMNIKGIKTDSKKRKLGAVIGDFVKTGIGVNITPGVKIGTKSVISPNITIWEDIPNKKIVNLKRIVYNLKEWDARD